MAVIAKQRYKLDIAPKGGWVIVYASQHDNGAREIEFEITNQGNAFSIPASINVSVQGIKSNKSYFSHSCSYSGNIVTMALADDMTDVVGKAICVLKFTNQSNQKLATAKFVLNVDTDSSSEGVIIDTEAEEIFNQMLNDIRAQAASISADIAELQSMVGSPLVASTVSAMTDHNKIYVYTGSESGYTNGNWYYWNGSAWTSGGVYNSTAFETDKTLSVENMAADAKAVGDKINEVKTSLNSILKSVTVGTGYGINIFGESFSTLKITGSVFGNALIRKCGKNLFNADEFDTKTEYIANTEKSYQPYLPIFVKPNTTYKVTFNMVDRETYDATTWNDKQWVSADTSTLSGIDSSLFASIDTKTVNITSGPSGCLYFVNVWDKQSMLDAFFQCFEVIIVESGIYDDYTTFEAYDGEDVAFSDFVTIGDYENFIIHRPVSDTDLRNALPESVITWGYTEIDVDSQIATAEEYAKEQSERISAQNKIIPIFIDTIGDYNWVSKYEVTAFSANNPAYADGTTDGNNGYFAVTGNSGDNYVTVVSGGNADISSLSDTDKSRWLGGVLIDDDGNGSPCNFFYKSPTELYVYPSLTKNITNGQLGNIQTGIHLSKRGYKGYAQHIWGINPKHCEKSKYIKKYRVGDTIPFTIYGGAVGVRVDVRNVPVQYQSKYGQSDYIFNMDWGSSSWHNTETGLEWEVDITGRVGYFEAYIGNSGLGENTSTINTSGDSYDFDYPTGAEIHCDLYVDDVLVDSYVKISKKLERVCLDFADGKTAKVKIYSSKWQETNYGFSVGAMTWWVNERWTDNGENPYLYKAITQLFDSWGDFQTQEVQNELEYLHQSAIGTPVPINNKSMRNMTSQWGRLWFYEYVQQYNATVMIIDFGINDYNSNNTAFPDEVAPDGSTWNVSFTLETYAESMRKLITMAVKNNILPIVMCIGWRSGDGNDVYTWTQAAIDAQAESI